MTHVYNPLLTTAATSCLPQSWNVADTTNIGMTLNPFDKINVGILILVKSLRLIHLRVNCDTGFKITAWKHK